jgi:hypothetical protein
MNNTIKTVFRYLFIGLIYLIAQGIIEMIVIIVLEQLGVKVLEDFSSGNLLTENIEGVIWSISMKMAIFSIAYLPLLAIVSFLLNRQNKNNHQIFSILNLVLSEALLLTLSLLKHLDLTKMYPVLLVTLIASIIIMLVAIYKVSLSKT